MGKSAKFTRGGNKTRVNAGRLKTKMERYQKEHGVSNATTAEVATRMLRGQGAATAAEMAARLRAIQNLRDQRAQASTAVRMAAPAAAAAPKKQPVDAHTAAPEKCEGEQPTPSNTKSTAGKKVAFSDKSK